MVELLIAVVLASTPPTPPEAPHAPVVPTPKAVPEAKPHAEARPEKQSEVKPSPDKHADAKRAAEAPVTKDAPAEPTEAPTPPALSRRALCAEVTRTNKELQAARGKLDSERKALDQERKELEKLKADIEQSRAGLRAETERLEQMLGQRPEGGGPPQRAEAPKTASSPVRPLELDALAKTMKSMKPEAAAALVQRFRPVARRRAAQAHEARRRRRGDREAQGRLRRRAGGLDVHPAFGAAQAGRPAVRLDALSTQQPSAQERDTAHAEAPGFGEALALEQAVEEEPQPARTELAPKLQWRGAAPQAQARPRFDTLGEAAPAETAKPGKKPRAMTEEALLVSRELSPHARPAPLIGTKAQHLKATEQKAVGVEQLATRARLDHEPARLTTPAQHRPLRAEPSKEPAPREKKLEEPVARRADDGGPQRADGAAPLAASAEPFRLEAPPPVQDAAPLVPLAPLMNDDASLRVVLLPTVARMSLDAGDAGRLHVQVKVRDGVTEIRATGPAAPLLEARQGELRVALAKEGLALGHFNLTQSGSQQHRHAERQPHEVLAPPTVRRAAGSSDPATEAGRVHVKA